MDLEQIYRIAFTIVLLAITTAGLVVWVRLLAAKNESYLSTSRVKPFGLIDVLICFLAWSAETGVVISALTSYWGVKKLSDLPPTQASVASIVVSLTQIIVIVAVMILACYRYGAGANVFGIERKKFAAHASMAVKAIVMLLPWLLLIQFLLSFLVPYQHNTLSQLRLHFSWLTVFSTWFGAVVAAPICEEVLFRGFLQGWLQRLGMHDGFDYAIREMLGGWPEPKDDKSSAQTGTLTPLEGGFSNTAYEFWWPVVISSALFAIIHIGQGLACIPLFFFGMALGFLYRVTGSVLPAILLHVLLNGFTMFWATIEAAISAN